MVGRDSSELARADVAVFGNETERKCCRHPDHTLASGNAAQNSRQAAHGSDRGLDAPVQHVSQLDALESFASDATMPCAATCDPAPPSELVEGARGAAAFAISWAVG